MQCCHVVKKIKKTVKVGGVAFERFAINVRNEYAYMYRCMAFPYLIITVWYKL